jgi:hypothetical protein
MPSLDDAIRRYLELHAQQATLAEVERRITLPQSDLQQGSSRHGPHRRFQSAAGADSGNRRA